MVMDVSPPCSDITPDELAMHDGRDPFRRIYFSVQGRVYDVTADRDRYGPSALAATVQVPLFTGAGAHCMVSPPSTTLVAPTCLLNLQPPHVFLRCS